MGQLRTYEIPTSLTLTYRESRWGLERIILDSASNHLPADSQGTHIAVKLMQDGKWVDLQEADPTKSVEEILFEDNGKGYPAEFLSLLYTTKAADALSVGQFGEGLKLVAAAALRAGESVEYRSRNWVAQPFSKELTVEGRRVDQLHFRITENGEQITGSRTVFYRPSQKLVDEVFHLPEKVLQLNHAYAELYNERDRDIRYSLFKDFGALENIMNTPKIELKDYNFEFDISRLLPASRVPQATKSPKYSSRIIDLHTEKTALFVKGVRIESRESLFSYDLGLENITPDRIYGDEESIIKEIGSLLKGCSNEDVIDTVLTVAHDNPNRSCDEFRSFENRRLSPPGDFLFTEELLPEEYRIGSRSSKIKKGIFGEATLSRWVTRFKKLYGDNAVLADEKVHNDDAQYLGFTPVRLNRQLASYLKSQGIQTAKEVAEGIKQEYRWTSIDDLTEPERQVLSLADKIAETALGSTTPVEIKVYEGLYTESGRELPSSRGVYLRNPGGSAIIGVKRSRLKSVWEFAHTTIHETGHDMTKAGDADRTFTSLFVDRLTEMTLDKLGIPYERPPAPSSKL